MQAQPTNWFQTVSSENRPLPWAFTQVIQLISNHYLFPQFVAPKTDIFILLVCIFLSGRPKTAGISKSVTAFIKGSINQNHENDFQYCPLSGAIMTIFDSTESALYLNSSPTQKTPSASSLNYLWDRPRHLVEPLWIWDNNFASDMKVGDKVSTTGIPAIFSPKLDIWLGPD